MQQRHGTRDSESAPAVTVTVTERVVWLGRLAVFSMRNTVKTLVFHRGAAGWSRLVGARKGVRFDAGGAVTSGGFIFGTGQFVSQGGGERNKRVEKSQEAKKQESRGTGKKRREEKNKCRGTDPDCGEEKLPDGS
jgi:hypothetical protein